MPSRWVSPSWEHIKKESNKSGLGDQEEGEEIAKTAPIDPTHNGGAATTVGIARRREGDESGVDSAVSRVRHYTRLLFIM